MMFCKAEQCMGAGLTTSMSDEKRVSRTMPALTGDSVEILYLPVEDLDTCRVPCNFRFSIDY